MRSLGATALVIVLLAGGCSAAAGGQPSRGPALPLEAVQTGMPAPEVRALLGEPAKVERVGARTNGSGREIWYYSDGGVVILEDGRVVFKNPAPPPDS